mmetsp:Transcript_315/g.327  ORF Transcript_315/g.327 Transcript_315/m.327 type:complete len:466 (-) Transcript_315:287-1684(-)|eukprot:CAMPEP_0197847804 /NCGR_PEP_ID=MMETSP1438-20131217/7142_1 /TAXON_ID=1461541 /ORGANISM="Pterosperma sp., Strain CCMP1384" /LENGTH=465 /DNA_ID=CAMNT_0043459833 /DNA_START=299 /DNA_END=1696 /DNA_ORIENTATION=+
MFTVQPAKAFCPTGDLKANQPSASVKRTGFLQKDFKAASTKGAQLHIQNNRQIFSQKQALRSSRSRRGCECTASAEGAAGTARPWRAKDARLVLEDGSIWSGVGFGATGTSIAEVVFNTSLTGYEEIMTDPSYAGQFVVYTCPHIGNTGINMDDVESQKGCHLGGIIIKSLSPTVSNYRSTETLDSYCKSQNVIGIAEVDTRSITSRIREKGALVGVISTDASVSDDDLVAKAQSWKIEGKDMIAEVTTDTIYEWTDPTIEGWEFNVDKPQAAPEYHVVAYDFGIKTNILRRLASYGCRITVVPASTPASEVLDMNPDGVFFSNGPGDPSAVPYAVENAKAILGVKPVFGICMGHQVLGQAFGASTYKLKFGHHGGNHPILFSPTGRVEISAQNHNYAVDPATLPEGVEVTHVNLNDGTCAGMLYPAKQAMTIQYHPEAAPGPHDADPAFAQFVDMMKGKKEASV